MNPKLAFYVQQYLIDHQIQSSDMSGFRWINLDSSVLVSKKQLLGPYLAQYSHGNFKKEKKSFSYFLYWQKILYKNQCRIKPSKDMKVVAHRSWYLSITFVWLLCSYLLKLIYTKILYPYKIYLKPLFSSWKCQMSIWTKEPTPFWLQLPNTETQM